MPSPQQDSLSVGECRNLNVKNNKYVILREVKKLIKQTDIGSKYK